MVHWIVPATTDVQLAVDDFDTVRFREDLRRTGARWLIFTVGQNTGHYASPNESLTRLTGPSHCSRRDLIAEIAGMAQEEGIKFIAYLPSEAAYAPESIRQGLGWSKTPGDQHEFQTRYLDVIAEWSSRWGRGVDGWWLDGCYEWPIFRNALYRWPDWYASLRSGNPDAALAFNDGCFCESRTAPVRAEHDYLSGEAEELLHGSIRLGRTTEGEIPVHLPSREALSGQTCRWHTLVPIDAFWGHGTIPPAWLNRRYADPRKLARGEMEPPLYSDRDLRTLLAAAWEVGGGVTFNVGIFEKGGLGLRTMEQLGRLAA